MMSRAEGPTLSPAAIAIIFDRTTASEVRVFGEDLKLLSRCCISVSTTVYEYCGCMEIITMRNV